MSTHNLCFGAKIRKIGIPLHTPVLLYKWGSRGYTLHGHVFVMSFIFLFPNNNISGQAIVLPGV